MLFTVLDVSSTDRYSVLFSYHGNLSTKLWSLGGSAEEDEGESQTVE
jgi:hypothetical protein